MGFDSIENAVNNNPDLLYRLLRDETVDIRLIAFDTFLRLLNREDSSAKKVFSDILTVIRVELIPNLSDESDLDKRGGLIHVLDGIQGLCCSTFNGGNFVPFIDTCFELTKHPFPKVKASALRTLGKLFMRNPDELDDTRANKMLRFFSSNEGVVRTAAVGAWSDLSISAVEKAVEAISPIYRLLQDDDAEVRAEAAGFFHSLADAGCDQCAVALPLLRQIKNSDTDDFPRERAGAAVQAINNSLGKLI